MIYQVSKRVLRWSIVILLCLCTSTPLLGTRTCCEGEQWLRWTDEVRQTYVLAFVLGYSKGYVKGCDIGGRNLATDSKPGLENDPTRNCRHEGLDFSKGTNYFVRLITDFYTRFPSDRDVYVEELIQCFAGGLSVEEAHKQHFPSRDQSKSKP